MQRAALIVGAVAVAVLALLVLRPSDDDEPTPASEPVRTQVREENHEAPPPVSRQGEAAAERERAARPVGTVARVRVRDGQPVGGVQRIVAESGEPVRIAVSGDAPEELHLHGYDLERPLAPGRPTVLRFRADLEGIYVLELHGSGAELAQLRVEP